MRFRILSTAAWLLLVGVSVTHGAHVDGASNSGRRHNQGRRGQEYGSSGASAVAVEEVVAVGPSVCCGTPDTIPANVIKTQGVELVNVPKDAIESGSNSSKASVAPPDSLVITVPASEKGGDKPDHSSLPGEEGEDVPTLEELGVDIRDTSMEGGGWKPVEMVETTSTWGVIDPKGAIPPVAVGSEGDNATLLVATTTMKEEPFDGVAFGGTGLDESELPPTVVDEQLVEFLETTQFEVVTEPKPEENMEPATGDTGAVASLKAKEGILREREHDTRMLIHPEDLHRRRHGDGGRIDREAAAKEHDINRKLQATQGINTWPIGLFNPLTCNANIATANCSVNKLSSLLSGTAKVTIPCGTCYTYDLPTTSTTIEGLDIVGKLYVPPNYRSTLLTKFVFVQGVLEMTDTNPISKNNTSMRIVLTGDTDVTFVPASGNAGVAASTFNAGVKPFLVAGGKLDIRGWTGSLAEGGKAETWTTLTETAEGARPNPALSSLPGKERTAIVPPQMIKATGELEQCPSKLVDHDFDVDVPFQVWSGGEGIIVHDTHDQGGAIKVGPITRRDGQGFKLDFTEIAKQCPLIAGATYLVTMRLKVDLPGMAPGTKTVCETTGSWQDCPRILRKILRTAGGDRYSEQFIQRGNMGRYSEWFWMSTLWTWTGDDLTNVVGNLFMIDFFQVNATISLDRFVFELPSSKSYAPQSDACAELAVNGKAEDNDGAGFSHYPFLSDLGTTNPQVFEETISGTSIINRFYRIRARSSSNVQLEFRPNSQCFVKGHVYTVSIRVRAYSFPGKMKIYFNLFGRKPNGDWVHNTILRCPEISQSNDWTSCSATLLVGEELASLTEIRWITATDMEDANNRALLDFDDISIKYTSGPSEGLKVKTDDISRWAANSDVHITSSTLSWRDSQDAVIDSIQVKDDGTSILKLNVGIDAVLSEKETPGMGVEVALLTRNIKIEGEIRVDLCGSDLIKQADYRGTIATSANGLMCQKWTVQTPIAHTRTPANYPNAGLGDHNYCRNPDGRERAWCYTSSGLQGCNVPMCRGGYLQVLHTPKVAQVIEGVELTNMGQQGFKNRFPIQFLYTRDVKGTSISRNSIRNSAHRCISMDGVSNATIAANVAHETAGHCYYIGLEANQNSILYNIGSKTNEMITWGEQLAGHSDHDRATFFLRSSENTFIGNVAAGSAGRGFDARIHWAFYGEDECYFCNGIDPNRRSNRQKPMGIFRSNKAHSNFWQGFIFENFEQFYAFRNAVNIPKFENTMAYRNREQGISTWNNVAAEYLGGKLSDNQWGIVIRGSDRVTLQDFDIVGSSRIFKDHTEARSLKLCSNSGWRHEGIMMPSYIWQTGSQDPGLGLRLRNVNISGFDKETQWYLCKSTEPIAIAPDLRDKQFDYMSSAKNVQISDSRAVIMDGCEVTAAYGVKDIVITDMDGSFDPSRNGTMGSIVQDYDHVKGILGEGACSSIGKCLAFCPNACLRKFSLKVEQFGTENWKLRIKNTITGTSMDVPGTILTINNAYFSDAYAGRRFSASLPAGTYTGEFINEQGVQVWPQYVEETWQKPPDCTGFAEVDSITILKPAISEQQCVDLIRNGGVDGNILTTQPWISTLGQPRELVVRNGLGVGGTNAIGTVNREGHWTGLGQDIDSRCMDLMRGKFYEFSAYMKITVKNDPSTPILTINPNRDIWQNLSPVVVFNGRSYQNISNKEFLSNWEDNDKAVLARPYNSSGFNLVHGIFRLPHSFRVFFEIERSPDNQDFIVDNVSFKRMVCNPDRLLLNGDLEEPNTKYWDTWGGDVSLGLVAGYGGMGQALKASTRPHLSHGPAQILNTDCVPSAGERLAFVGKIRFEKSAAPGVASSCNPFTWSDSLIRCSDIWMYTQKAGIHEWHRVAIIATDESDVDNGWYNIHGLWTLRPNQAQADYTKIYVDGISTAYDVIIDNMQTKHLPLQCNALIENPSFNNRSAAFWQPTDRDRMKLKLYSPGAGGPEDFALRGYARDHSWRGIRQQLDKRCFVTGQEYTISAKFRLLNATTGAGVQCNTNDQWYSGLNCPSVMIYGEECTVGGNRFIYWRFWNMVQGWQKDAYNDFSNGFLVNEALSSCLNVWVYINEIRKEWEVVVDDLQISKVQTPAPTLSPTATLTTEEDEATNAPTSSPTSMPTVSIVTSCPMAESVPTEIPDGPVKLARSSSLCVLTKAIQDSNGKLSNVAPVALSYDGRPWEKAGGEFAMKLLYSQEFRDYPGEGSQLSLPHLNNTGKYYLTSYPHRTISEADKVARLLETATFGTTVAELASFDTLTGDAAKRWIRMQMSMNLTSHREYFRKRATPRLTNPVGIARNGHPCDPGSRWRKFAFSKKEGENGVLAAQRFEATKKNATDPYITIKLNGHIRTVVKSLAFAAGSKFVLEFNKEYVMCMRPEEWVGGSFYLRMQDGSCQALPNPDVNFYTDSVQPHSVLSLPNVILGILDPIDEVRSKGGEFIVMGGLSDPICSQIKDVTEENDAAVFGKLVDGSWLMFDPRMVLEDNTIENHIGDGGGLTRSLTALKTKCANTPRTFLNEEHCSLSDSSMACSSAGTPSVQIELNAANILAMNDITGQYIYAIVGLPLRDVDNVTQPSPCVPNLRSRWEILDAAQCNQTPMGAETNSTLVNLLVQRSSIDLNPGLRDITFPMMGMSCSANDSKLVEADIIIKSKCFRRVHPDHLSVFDFTYWTEEDTHPGNMIAAMNNHPNPITKWMDLNRSAILLYPAKAPANPNATLRAHPIHRWDMYSSRFSKVGRFGDTMKFVDLPNEIRQVEVAEHFGADTVVDGGGIVACGSPYETENDPSQGYIFEVATERETDWDLWRQREYIWMQIGLTAPDQLRQRVAWAFAQVLVIARGAIEVEGTHTEAFATYYDIFVRNAFGSYRDILREIAYSPMMAENLSYLTSKSAAYMWENQQIISFADENFAREIMQLFSTGLVKLNNDGTPVIDDEGQPVLAYTNDEIMSFARIWTGFDYQQGRGNIEEHAWYGNRQDPMKIQAGWRDKFPKTDMTGGYIGDLYPLCSDLPSKMFLKKGASYRLLGLSTMPELIEDDPQFNSDPTLKRFVLAASSSLKTTLCNADPSGSCQWKNNVILKENINCTGKECEADTLRVVQVSDGINYEYVRPACVEQAFYANAKKIIYKQRQSDSSCANPLLSYASEACCEGTFDLTAERAISYLYDQERVTYSTAAARCQAMGLGLCDFNDITGISTHKKGYHWTTDGCKIQVKINAVGQVALVYEPESFASLHPHIRIDNRNFFKVYWGGDGDYPKNNNDVTSGNSCGNDACETLDTGGCLCGTTITESRVFRAMPTSVDVVLSTLHVGAYDIDAFPPDTYQTPISANGVTAYLASATGIFDTKTVFEVTDDKGRLHRLKNTRSMVAIQGASTFAFRNPPSFMSVLNTEATAREAHYETEAALDHYFYHDNTAPFIAFRLIQRFTTSNPTPSYVKSVAMAFRTGSYEGIGKGEYGDLAATIAAVLLHPEARSVVLDAYPFKGGLREPLLRLMALMRGMELKLAENQPIVKLIDLDYKIGEMAHNFRTVFSFFLPEYVPDGRAGEASLKAPEMMLSDMPKTVGLLNGVFSLVKYGLSRCNGGFGTENTNCNEGDFSRAAARLSYSRPYNKITATLEVQAENVVSELSTILTSGRLSDVNKRIIKDAYISKLNQTGIADPAGAALRMAQQLFLTTPEFHTTNTVLKTGAQRVVPPLAQTSGVPYKAIVYVLFGGGCDSYNMLVPHTCSKEKIDNMTLWDEYLEIRQQVALDRNSLNILNGNMTNQACETFGVHPRLGSMQKLFNDGDLLFFTNTGELTKETDKENYWRDTKTQLFAHNFQQLAAQRIDPLKERDGTGILGRIRDVLTKKKGRSVNAYALNANSVSLLGEPGTTATPMIISDNGVTPFNQAPSSADMDSRIALLNGETKAESGVFADLYSEKLMKSLANNKLLFDTLSGKTTTVVFPTSGLGRQLSMVAKIIDSRAVRSSDADMFFVETGGWDTHDMLISNQERLFADVDASIKAFADELKAKNIWNGVTLIETSDFARTLSPNGNAGTDHAWGGNYFMMGGNVRGGQIIGRYPSIRENAPLNIGRGRMIPTKSWESVFLPIAAWAGVDEADFDYICPNRDSFPSTHFTSASGLFEV